MHVQDSLTKVSSYIGDNYYDYGRSCLCVHSRIMLHSRLLLRNLAYKSMFIYAITQI